MNNISTHQNLNLDLKNFFSEHIPGLYDENTVLIRLNNRKLDGYNDFLKEVKKDSGKRACIVLLDSTGIGKVQKVAALLWRTRARIKIANCMRENDLKYVSSYALFPNADSARIVYELATDASQYAEDCLLPQQQNKIISQFTRLYQFLFGCSPRIDAIAIVGRK